MSGGYWNFKDQTFFDASPGVIESLPKMLEALRRCFRLVDLAEAGDISKKDTATEVYNIIKKLGDDVFL